MEYTYWLMGRASRTGFTVCSRLTGDVAPETVSRVLRLIQRRHPLCAVSIRPDDRYGAVFTECAASPIPLLVEQMPPPELSSIVWDTPLLHAFGKERDALSGIGPEPLVRCRLLKHAPDDTTMLLTFHHSIADAVSAIHLTFEIIDAIDRLNTGTPVPAFTASDVGPLERHIAGKHHGVSAMMKMMLHSNAVNLTRLLPWYVHIPADRKTWPDERAEQFVLSVLDEAATAGIIRSARARKCTVHAAVCAAQLIALKDQYPDKKSVGTHLLSLVDLRSRFETPLTKNTVNLLISMVETSHRIRRGASFWDLARDVNIKVVNRLNSGFPFYYFPCMTKNIHASYTFWRNGVSSARRLVRLGQCTRPMVLSVSNVGRIDTTTGGKTVNVRDMFFTLPLSTSGLFGSAICTFNNRMYLNFSYAYPSVATERAVRIVKSTVDTLKLACG